MTENRSLPFIDLKSQRAQLGDSLVRAIDRVLEHNAFIMGPEVEELEHLLSDFCGAKHVVTAANGTDAIALPLMAMGLTRGDAVFVPSFTFAATAEVVAWFGATPIFVDVQLDTFNIEPSSILEGMAVCRNVGLRPVGIIPVDLFGQPADYDALDDVASANRLWVLADAAQSFGATYHGKSVGTLASTSATSFFPAKPLGCYGDGGAVFTDNDSLAEAIRSLRVHGQGDNKYDNVRIGLNSRLDTLQAAILIEKLRIFPGEITARQRIAARYSESLRNVVVVPSLAPERTSVWAQYTIRLAARDRAAFAGKLRADGIPTAIYYPLPLHRQTAYRHFPTSGVLHQSERLAGDVLSLPMHPYLDEQTQDRIIERIHDAAR